MLGISESFPGVPARFDGLLFNNAWWCLLIQSQAIAMDDAISKGPCRMKVAMYYLHNDTKRAHMLLIKCYSDMTAGDMLLLFLLLGMWAWILTVTSPIWLKVQSIYEVTSARSVGIFALPSRSSLRMTKPIEVIQLLSNHSLFIRL